MKTKELQLDKIRLDGGTQQRAKIDEQHVAELADAIVDGAQLPPAKVYHDGSSYWLARGFHRWHAHKKASLLTMPCEVVQGSLRDAVLDACGDNADHGLKRSNACKRKAVTTLLEDEEWGKASDTWIAERCKVSADLVAKVRKELTEAGWISEKISRTTKDGREISTANRGRPPKSEACVTPAPVTPPSEDDCDWGDEETETANCADIEPRTAEDFYSGEAIEEPWTCPDPKEAAKAFLLVIRLLNEWEKNVLENIIASEEPGTAYFDERARSGFQIVVANLRGQLNTSKPHAVCPLCKGKRCRECRNSGLVTKRLYEAYSERVAG